MDASRRRAAWAAGLFVFGMAWGSAGVARAQGYGEDCPPSRSESAPRWTDEWYEIEAQSPVGARQKKKHGKLWPPFPRPQGKEQQCCHRFHAAHYWPFPYRCDDRAYVRELSAMQVDQGWMTETTLYDFHFNPDTQDLNHAGRLKLRWILEIAPIQHRQVFVQTGTSLDQSQSRLQSTQSEAVQMVAGEPLPPIAFRVTSAAGRPAVEIDTIRRRELESMPNPRIQYTPNPTAGTSSGGGAGGGM